MNTAGRVALITGGRRIGAVVATSLAARGTDVVLTCNRSVAEAESTANAVRAAGRRALVLQADLADEAACLRVVAQTVQQMGRLDILVNMASLYEAEPIDTLSSAAWDRQLAVDLRATYLCSRAALASLRASGGGRIVNVSDWVAASARPRYPGYAHYYTAKAGVKAFTEALALEVAADGILVNAVAPGPIVAPPGTTPEEHAAVVEATPLGRWGGEAEIAKAVLFLIDSDFVTGETIRVDGGRHLR